MLVSVKFIHLLLILVLLVGKLSDGYSPEGLSNMAAGGCNVASIGKPLADESQNQSGLRKSTLRGRKIRPEKVNGSGQYQETCVTSSGASVEEQRQVSVSIVKVKLSRRSFVLEKKKLAGFGAFTADYGKPMHHPPKNN